MASGGTSEGSVLQSSLIMGGIDDGVTRYSGQQQGYENTSGVKRLVGLSGAGHLAFSDLCLLGRENGGLVEIAQNAGVSGAAFASFLWDGCDEGQLAAEISIEIVKDISTLILEEVLQCRGSNAAEIAQLGSRYPDVGEYLESLE